MKITDIYDAGPGVYGRYTIVVNVPAEDGYDTCFSADDNAGWMGRGYCFNSSILGEHITIDDLPVDVASMALRACYMRFDGSK